MEVLGFVSSSYDWKLPIRSSVDMTDSQKNIFSETAMSEVDTTVNPFTSGTYSLSQTKMITSRGLIQFTDP